MSGNTKTVIAKWLTTMLVIVVAAPAMADLPGPGPRSHPPHPNRFRPDPAPDTVPMVIRVDPQAKDSVLKIPKQLLPAAKLGSVDESQPASPGTFRHILAALALSGAITGLFFVRRDRKFRAAVVILVCVCAIAVAGSLMADIPSPAPRPVAPPTPNLNNGVPPLPNGENGNVVIQVTDDGTAVTLILSGKLAKSSGLSTTTDAPVPAVSAPAHAPNPTAPNSPAR